MSTPSHLDLLPAADESPRCAAFTRDLGISPAGTAIRADQVIVIETPRPWPMPVKTHRYLAGLMDLLDDAPHPTRILAAVPTGTADTIRVLRFRRSETGAQREAFRVGAVEQLPALVKALLTDSPDRHIHAVDEPNAPDQVLLICTQGSHDICCGSEGTRLAIEARAAFGHVEVLEVSHTGGHRFAPTGMTLPDGRMWASLDVDALRSFFDRTATPADLADRCRGWWGADGGFAQTAENAVFARLSWDELDGPNHPRRVTAKTHDDSAAPEAQATCHVTVGPRQFTVVVQVARAVPTIACGKPGGLPAKPSREFGVASVVEH